MKLQVRKIGNSEGVILPKELLARLKLKAGDELIVTETPDGAMLTPYDEVFARQMEAARKGMRKYRNALRQLAK
jgi:putative addiction module antidote